MKTSRKKALRSLPALFLQAVFHLGVVKTFGVFLPELKSKLGLTPTDIGISLGLFQGCSYGMSPISVYLYCKGERRCRQFLLITGAVLASGGLLMASTISNNFQLAAYLTLSGIGSNIIHTAIVITLDSQSGEDFKVVYGIGKSGFALGMAVMPIIAHYLMEIYGWRGSLMLFGGVMTHLIPFSMLIDTSLERREEKYSTELEDDKNTHITQTKNCQFSQSDESRNESELLSCDPGSNKSEESKRQSLLKLSTTKTETSYIEKRALGRKQPKLNELQSSSNSDSNHIQNMVTRCHAIFEKMIHVITESIFYQDPWLTCLISVLGIFGVVDGAWHAFLIPRAMSRGIPTSKALTLAYSAGAGCFMGRCISGVLPNTRCFGQLEWFLSATFLNGSSLLVDILILNFDLMIVTSFMSAMFIAELDVLQVTLCQERCPSAAYPVALAVGETLFGTADLLGTSIAGYLADYFADFNASFTFMLVVEACIFIMMVILKFTKQRT